MNKEQLKKKNEPPLLSLSEEIINAISHGIGALFAIIAMILLLLKSNSEIKMIASLIYGMSMILLMSMSCLYHAFKSKSTIKRIWRRFDYMSIYLLITGTFAPLLLVEIHSTYSFIVCMIQWIVVLFGITIIAIFGPGKWSALHFTLYFVIGWSGMMFVPYFYQHNQPLLMMIFIGGMIYTLGMIPFALNKKYFHSIWHLFVLGGAIIHWIGIYLYVY
ncbi:MAG: hemolysin III family protein [Traorella sp.]